jgi:hypothetical protein
MLEKAHAVRVTLADMRPQWQQDLTHTDANLAAADAIELQMNGKNFDAGQAYVRAADLNQQMAAVSQRDELIERTMEFDEWAATAFTNAGALDKAREQLVRAIDVAKNHHSMVGNANMSVIVARLEGLLQASQK